MTIFSTTPFAGQRPGTSGLRKKVSVFAQPHYTENYLQAVFESLPAHDNNVLIVGCDGRYHCDVVIGLVLRMAAANGIERCIVGLNGWLSTPAASHLVRTNNARGAIILTASHNPGGATGDFGIKLNLSNGGPAPQDITERIYLRTQNIEKFSISDSVAPRFDAVGISMLETMVVETVDAVHAYVSLMQSIFDFDQISSLAKSGFRLTFDGMNGVSGPYAETLFVKALGFPDDSVIGKVPLPDFGGLNPDPNPVHAQRLFSSMMRQTGADFGAASDSDGDRHMIMGQGFYVTPSDSLAIMAQHMHLAPGYAGGISGVARSLGTSSAVDRVARKLRIPCFETPTGWRYFGNLLDAGLITLCGEESSGASSNHIREKDGLWAILLWLNILAVKRIPVAEIVGQQWKQFGRTYYERRDYEEVDEGACATMLDKLRSRLNRISGRGTVLGAVTLADDFTYQDVVDGTVSSRQGIRFCFEAGGRVVLRLSGTGTTGATLRVYGERHDPVNFTRPVAEFLEPVFDLVDQIAGVSVFTKRYEPTLVT